MRPLPVHYASRDPHERPHANAQWGETLQVHQVPCCVHAGSKLSAPLTRPLATESYADLIISMCSTLVSSSARVLCRSAGEELSDGRFVNAIGDLSAPECFWTGPQWHTYIEPGRCFCWSYKIEKKRTQLDVEMIIMLVGALLLNSDAPV